MTGLGDNPTLSLLAVFPGALVIVPPYVSLYNGVKRFQRAQQATLGGSTLNGWIVLGLHVGAFVVPFAALVVPGYIQEELNRIWEPHPRPGVEPAAVGDADLDRIKKLAELRDSGAISAEELEAEKARVLHRPTPRLDDRGARRRIGVGSPWPTILAAGCDMPLACSRSCR